MRKLIAAILLLLPVADVTAGVMYEGIRTDYNFARPELNFKALISEDHLRLDVFTAGVPRISVIKIHDTIIIIDHTTGQRNARSLIEPSAMTTRRNNAATNLFAALPIRDLRATPRKQFSLGVYCRVDQIWEADHLQKELCMIEADRAPISSGASRFNVALLGELLSALAVGDDLSSLLRIPQANVSQTLDPELPYIIRCFESGVAVSELRLLRVTTLSFANNAFNVPRAKKTREHINLTTHHSQPTRADTSVTAGL